MVTGIKIGPLTLNFYGLLIMLGVIAAAILSFYEAKRRNLNTDVILDSLTWIVIGGVIGARLWHIFTPPASMVAQGITTQYYLTHPLAAIAVWRGGLGIPGAVAGGAFAFYLYSKKRGLKFGLWADIFAPGLALGQAIGRWGNFINQEVYGSPSDLPWAITIDPQHRLPEFMAYETYHPYFDAKNLEENWQNLVNDENAPLVNRATQGLSPPGSTLFPFVATTQIEYIQQNDTPGSLMSGSAQLQTCATYPGDDLTWQAVITSGCQSIQAKLAESTGVNTLLELFQNLRFFSPPDIRLNVAQADSPESDPPDALFQGQGAFNLTPLQMALAASALTNQGILPAPRLVNAYQDSAGNWVTLPKLGQNTQAIKIEEAHWLTSLLEIPGTPHWQVISKVATRDEQTITWFIAGTTVDWQGQPTVVVVLVEKDAPQLAEKIGLSLLEQTIQTSSTDNQ